MDHSRHPSGMLAGLANRQGKVLLVGETWTEQRCSETCSLEQKERLVECECPAYEGSTFLPHSTGMGISNPARRPSQPFNLSHQSVPQSRSRSSHPQKSGYANLGSPRRLCEAIPCMRHKVLAG